MSIQKDRMVRDNHLLTRKPRKGANVYGLPMSRELASFLDDVAPDSRQQLMFTMFFAGHLVAPVSIQEYDEGF